MKNSNDSLDQLTIKFLDGTIRDEELNELRSTLETDPSFLQDFRENLIFSQCITTVATPDDQDFVNQVLQNVAESSKPASNIVRFWKPAAAVGIAALLLLTLCLSIFTEKQTPAPVVVAVPNVTPPPTPIVVTPAVEIPVVKKTIATYQNLESGAESPLTENQRVKELTASHKITFNNGAILSLEAPFSGVVIDEKNFILETGLLAAHCPSEESAITVKVGDRVIKDLGTAFIVKVQDNEDVDLQVLSGSVSAKCGAVEKTFKQNEATLLTDKNEFKETPFNPGKYASALAALSTTKLSTPDSVKVVNVWDLNNQDLGKDQVLVALEKTDILGNSHFTPLNKSTGKAPSKSYTTYLVRALPLKDNESPPRKGAVTFPAPIVGVITEHSGHIAFEDKFGINHTDAGFSRRGLEDIKGSEDIYTISPDGKTIEFTLNSYTTIDDIRIFIAN